MLVKFSHFLFGNKRIQAILHICVHYVRMIELCIGKQIMPPGRFIFLHFSPSHVADLSTSHLRHTPSFKLRRAAYCWKSSIVFFSATNAFAPVIKPLRTYVFITHTWQSHVSESTSCHPYNLSFSIFLHLMWHICPPHL